MWKNFLGLEKGRGGLTQSSRGKGQYEDESHKRGGKCLVFLEAWDVIDHGIKMSFALYNFMEKDCMLKSLKANFVLNTKVLL